MSSAAWSSATSSRPHSSQALWRPGWGHRAAVSGAVSSPWSVWRRPVSARRGERRSTVGSSVLSSGCLEERSQLGLAWLAPDRGQRPVLPQVGVGGGEEDELGERPELAVKRADARVGRGEEEQLGEDGVARLPGARAGVRAVAVELRLEPLDGRGAEVDLDEQVVDVSACLVAGVAVGAEKQRCAAGVEAVADGVFALPPVGRAAVACVGAGGVGEGAGEVAAREGVPDEEWVCERVPGALANIARFGLEGCCGGRRGRRRRG